MYIAHYFICFSTILHLSNLFIIYSFLLHILSFLWVCMVIIWTCGYWITLKQCRSTSSPTTLSYSYLFTNLTECQGDLLLTEWLIGYLDMLIYVPIAYGFFPEINVFVFVLSLPKDTGIVRWTKLAKFRNGGWWDWTTVPSIDRPALYRVTTTPHYHQYHLLHHLFLNFILRLINWPENLTGRKDCHQHLVLHHTRLPNWDCYCPRKPQYKVLQQGKVVVRLQQGAFINWVNLQGLVIHWVHGVNIVHEDIHWKTGTL